jgi:hypothetical protein
MNLASLALRGPSRSYFSALTGGDELGHGLSSLRFKSIAATQNDPEEKQGLQIGKILRNFAEGLAKAVAPLSLVAVVGSVGLMVPGDSDKGPSTDLRMPATIFPEIASKPAKAAPADKAPPIDNVLTDLLKRISPVRNEGMDSNFVRSVRRFPLGEPGI